MSWSLYSSQLHRYRVLLQNFGLKDAANPKPEEIRKACLSKLKEYHPDVNKAPNASNEFLRFKEHYEELKRLIDDPSFQSLEKQRRHFDTGKTYASSDVEGEVGRTERSRGSARPSFRAEWRSWQHGNQPQSQRQYVYEDPDPSTFPWNARKFDHWEQFRGRRNGFLGLLMKGSLLCVLGFVVVEQFQFSREQTAHSALMLRIARQVKEQIWMDLRASRGNDLPMRQRMRQSSPKGEKAVSRSSSVPSDVKTMATQSVQLMRDKEQAPTRKHSAGSKPFAIFDSIRRGDLQRLIQLTLQGFPLDRVRDAAGRNALHVATEWKRLDVARLLLLFNVDPTAKDTNGENPVQLARRLGYKDLEFLLLFAITGSLDAAQEFLLLRDDCQWRQLLGKVTPAVVANIYPADMIETLLLRKPW